jgi:hypothetical protein
MVLFEILFTKLFKGHLIFLLLLKFIFKTIVNYQWIAEYDPPHFKWNGDKSFYSQDCILNI